jgi:hypothetical protein
MTDQRIEQGGTYQMLWDCQYCGTKKLLGVTHRFCPNCGAAQNPAARYFPADDEKIAVEDHELVGADIICPACGTANSGKSNNCQQCGAPLEGGERASTLGDEVRAENARFESSGSRDIAMERFQAEMARVGGDNTQGKGKRNWIIIAVVVALVACVGLVLLSIFWTRTDSVQVVGHSWERAIDIESLSPVQDSAWCDSMPGDAYSVSRRQEQRDTRRVQDGEECSIRRVDNGDGSFSERRECRPTYREEPIYDDRCYFTVDRWRVTRTATAEGDSLSDTPAWPPVNLARTGNCLGCEREGSRREAYTVHFRLPERQDSVDCNYDQERWQQFAIESQWQVNVSVVTGQMDCGSVESPG